MKINYLAFEVAAINSLVVHANTNADDTAGIFGQKDDWETGFIPIDTDSQDHDIFYWLIKSRQNQEIAPLVIWLTGGPGCSSEVGIFYENGPWRFDDGDGIKENPYTWNTVANMLFID